MRREMTRGMEFAGVVLDDAKNVKVGHTKKGNFAIYALGVGSGG